MSLNQKLISKTPSHIYKNINPGTRKSFYKFHNLKLKQNSILFKINIILIFILYISLIISNIF